MRRQASPPPMLNWAPTMTDLTDLIARVEKLEGPDREVDALLADTFMERAEVNDVRRWGWVRWRFPGEKGAHKTNFTASLDAALALVERVLPGWGAEFSTMPPTARLFDGQAAGLDYYAEHETIALALILVLLRALESTHAPSP